MRKKIILTLIIMLVTIGNLSTRIFADDQVPDTEEVYEYTDLDGLLLVSGIRTKDMYIKFSYDTNGFRIEKDINGYKHLYSYDDDKLISDKTSDYEFVFFYGDKKNCPDGFFYNCIQYRYVFDQDMRVIGICDDNGEIIVKYNLDYDGVYSSYENLKLDDEVELLAQRNPYIGMGFYYDMETGYLCIGRLWNPHTHKFVGEYDKMETLTPTPYSHIDLIGERVDSLYSYYINQSSFGTPKNFSSNWYDDMETVELLARVIYGENTSSDEYDDRRAVAWTFVYRNNDKLKFVNSEDISQNSQQMLKIFAVKGYKTAYGDSEGTHDSRQPVTSSIAWRQATRFACMLITSLNIDDWNVMFGKPSYYQEEDCFLSFDNAKNSISVKNGNIVYTYGGKDLLMDMISVMGYNRLTIQDIQKIKEGNKLWTGEKNIFFRYNN